MSEQNISVENRETIRITGVTDVNGFDETYIDLSTELGDIMLRGTGLKIGKLSLEQHELVVNGYFYSCVYDDQKEQRAGVLRRIFR